MSIIPTIPEKIRVHLGAPSQNAQNVSVSFPDYIKNVASSEIYPTWPEAALRANIYAQISFALNRIYTEYYPSRGYDFDITNSTSIDQSFVYGREYFENISRIVDEIFNDYIVRRGNIEPLFALYCNGTTATCDGLSQWGTVSLANEGLGAYDILTRYYGEDIDIIQNAPVVAVEPSSPANPLRLGSAGNDVSFIQLRLNRISANYPKIPKISPVDGVFGTETENAVRTFQEIFNLVPDGIVGKATWYKIQFIYNAVKRLNELNSEGLTLDEVSKQFRSNITPGDTGEDVYVIQYYLRLISVFNPKVSFPDFDGEFGSSTEQALLDFQREYGLEQTGIVDRLTWYKLFDVYYGFVKTLTAEQIGSSIIPFPGTFLKLGAQGEDVLVLQEFLNVASAVYPAIPEIPETSVFDEATRNAVYAAQEFFGLPVNGIVGPLLWDTLSSLYSTVQSGNVRNAGQWSGANMSTEE